MLVESVEDRITLRRHATLKANPLLSNIKLDFCYAADLTPEAERDIDVWRFPDVCNG